MDFIPLTISTESVEDAIPDSLPQDKYFEDHLIYAISRFRGPSSLVIDVRAMLIEDPLIAQLRHHFKDAKFITQDDLNPVPREALKGRLTSHDYFAVIPYLKQPVHMLFMLGNIWNTLRLEPPLRYALYVHLSIIPRVFTLAQADVKLLLPPGELSRHRLSTSSFLLESKSREALELKGISISKIVYELCSLSLLK